jgi:GT2 family glycosyltransferase
MGDTGIFSEKGGLPRAGGGRWEGHRPIFGKRNKSHPQGGPVRPFPAIQRTIPHLAAGSRGRRVDTSIIIPSYNDGPLLARCLDSLLHLEAPAGSWEVVVALDGSRDGSDALVRRGLGGGAAGPLDALVERGAWAGLPLRLLALPTNRGRSAARNAAVAAARGEWLCFLDADLRVGPTWLACLAACCRDERDVAVGEMVYESAATEQPDPAVLVGDAAADARRRRGLKRYQRYLETRGPWKHRLKDEMPARYFYTCNARVHASLLRAAGPFDERLRGWGGEDIDMGLRLGEAGGRLVPCPRARALHAQERSFAAHCANLEALGRVGLPLLVERHPGLAGMLQLDRLAPASAGGRPQPLLVAARALGLHHVLVALEATGLPFPDKLYDLTVYLHYAGAYRGQALDARRPATASLAKENRP